MRYLIINADDFGMSKEVNEGTIQGIKAGTITSVSVMVNMPHFEEAVKFLKKIPKSQLDFTLILQKETQLPFPEI